MRLLVAILSVGLFLLPSPAAAADAARTPTAPTPILERPPEYSSKNGVLHLRVRAIERGSTINNQRFGGMFRYQTNVVDGKGTFRRGSTSAYIGPTWRIKPGDRVIVDYVNLLPPMNFQAVGETEASPIPQPLNLHTHGLTVSPAGNSDNVLLQVPTGRSNRYVFKIPTNHNHGLYWYHPHVHGITDDQVYEGLAGFIVVGRADGDYRQFNRLKIHEMAIRYNVAVPGMRDQLVDAGASDSRGTALPPRGAMNYTVNGLVAPSINISAANTTRNSKAESQVWAFTNITGSATYVLALEEVALADAKNAATAGTPVPFTIVSVDGTPMPTPIVLDGDRASQGYLLGQGSRVAILVQGASDPSKVVRLIQVQNRSGTGDASAYNWPEQTPTAGWRDYTRDVLAIGYSGTTTAARHINARHVDTPSRLTTNYRAKDTDLTSGEVVSSRTFIYNAVSPATPTQPNNFGVDFKLFPDNPIAQPKIGTIEEWTVLNYSSLHHPFHVHTQHSQVMSIDSPLSPAPADGDNYPTVQNVTNLTQSTPAKYNQDVVNIPPALVGMDGMPVLGPDGIPVTPGKAVIRIRVDDYLGTYVEHCHRLPHEDRGMMSLVRSIPHDPPLVITGTGRQANKVSVLSSSDWSERASFVPFRGAVKSLATAVGDVDGDAIPDVAIATGPGRAAEVAVYSGSSDYKKRIISLRPFGVSRSGANVALGDLNGDGADEIIVGSAANSAPRVRIWSGRTHERLTNFRPYPSAARGGVSVAAGSIDGSGRVSLITAPGEGSAPNIHIYEFNLFGDADGNMPSTNRLRPLRVARFLAGASTDMGGIGITTGYPFAAEGGFANIITTPRSGTGPMLIFEVRGDVSHGHDVSPTGTVRPEGYGPRTPRHTAIIQTVDLTGRSELGAGVVAGSVSTSNGATIALTPVTGGVISLWGIGETGLLEFISDLNRDGASLSGM